MPHSMYIVLVVIALAVWGFAAFTWFKMQSSSDHEERKVNTKKYNIAVVLFAAIIGLGLISSFIEESKAQSEASTILNAKIISVDVNGTPTKDYSIIISDIKKMDTSPFRYHHSHPLKFDFTVRVHTDKGDATFILNPDSSTPYQYWLYYRSKATHSYNDIGFVQTTAIDR